MLSAPTAPHRMLGALLVWYRAAQDLRRCRAAAATALQRVARGNAGRAAAVCV